MEWQSSMPGLQMGELGGQRTTENKVLELREGAGRSRKGWEPSLTFLGPSIMEPF